MLLWQLHSFWKEWRHLQSIVESKFGRRLRSTKKVRTFWSFDRLAMELKGTIPVELYLRTRC